MYRAHESLSTPPIPRGGAAGHYPFKIDQLEYALHIGESGSVWLNLEGGVTRKGSVNRNPCDDLFWDAPNFSDVDLGVVAAFGKCSEYAGGSASIEINSIH